MQFHIEDNLGRTFGGRGYPRPLLVIGDKLISVIIADHPYENAIFLARDIVQQDLVAWLFDEGTATVLEKAASKEVSLKAVQHWVTKQEEFYTLRVRMTWNEWVNLQPNGGDHKLFTLDDVESDIVIVPSNQN